MSKPKFTGMRVGLVKRNGYCVKHGAHVSPFCTECWSEEAAARCRGEEPRPAIKYREADDDDFAPLVWLMGLLSDDLNVYDVPVPAPVLAALIDVAEAAQLYRNATKVGLLSAECDALDAAIRKEMGR